MVCRSKSFPSCLFLWHDCLMRTRRVRYFASLASLAVVAVLLSTMNSATAGTGRVLNENSANKTYAIKVGTSFHLVLHSTYWSLTPLPASAPIKSLGDPVAALGSNSPSNPPGMGTGSLDWALKAVRVGKFSLQATRTSCGEALRCTDSQSKYLVNIKITK